MSSSNVNEFINKAQAGTPIFRFVFTLLMACLILTACRETHQIATLRKNAAQGDTHAQLILALRLAVGEGLKQDKAEAAKWFRRAAEQGNADAQTLLGTCYLEGNGVDVDDTEAEQWFRRAAEQGDKDAALFLTFYYSQQGANQ